jgi:thymidylate synthase (FAD)
MQLIKPSFIIIEQESGLEGMYKQIELAGRTCYKSEDKITKTSAKEFVDRMIKSGHGAMLEHGTVYLSLDMASREQYFKYCYNKFSKAKSTGSAEHSTWKGFVTTNLRVLVENGWLEDLNYQCEPTEYHEKRITVKFTCDRGVTHEFVRHRVFSFAQESTRYCNYSKSKFGEELTFIEPCWPMEELDRDIFISHLSDAESHYMALLHAGWKPQQARAVLPTAIKAELVMTGFMSDWEHFFYLRTPMNAHPQARELAIPLLEEFKNRKYIK